MSLTPEQINNFVSLLFAIGLGAGALLLGFRRSMIGRVNANQDELQKLQGDYDTARRENRDLRNRIEELSRQVDASTALIREVDRTNAIMQGRLTEQGNIYGKQLTDQASDIAHLKQQVAERDAQITSLKQSVEGKDQTLITANAMIDQLKAELAKEQKDRAELTKRVETLERQVKAMQSEKEELIHRIDELTGAISQVTAERDTARAALAIALAEIDALKTAQKPAEVATEVKPQ